MNRWQVMADWRDSAYPIFEVRKLQLPYHWRWQARHEARRLNRGGGVTGVRYYVARLGG